MSQITYRVHKASPVMSNNPTPGATIVIEDAFPDLRRAEWDKTEHSARALMEADAASVFAALSTTLPQGTLHRLLALMIKNYAGTMLVPAVSP